MNTNETNHETVGDVLAWARSRIGDLREQAARFDERPGKTPLRCAQICRTEAGILEKIADRIERAHARESAAQVGIPDHVRKLIGRIDTYRMRMSYNDSYFGEPAGLLKGVFAELAHAVNPIYPSGKTAMLSAAPAAAAEPAHPSPEPAGEDYDLLDENLPGMWERADLIGGETDSGHARAPQPAPSSACGCAHAKRKQCAQLRQATDCIVCQCACHERKPSPSDAPASPQAAQGDASVSAADVSIESYPEPPAGGMTFGVPRGVKATHRPTGCVAIVTHHRSQHINRDAAIAALSAAIANGRPAAQAETGAAGSAQGDVEALVKEWRSRAKENDAAGRIICASILEACALDLEHRLASAQPNSSATITGSAEFKAGDRVEWDRFGPPVAKYPATIEGVTRGTTYTLRFNGGDIVRGVTASSLTRLTGGSHD